MTALAAGPREVCDLAAFRARVAALLADAPSSYQPVFIQLRPGERPALEALCLGHAVTLVDSIQRQLADLAAVRLPGGTVEERARCNADLVDRAGDVDACGLWVLLPWERRIAHLLDPEAYLEVITSRNREKITRDEQRLLRTRRVGAVGLSVGGEAAVAVAQEHLCGEMVLADFDALDLSNLNRLGAGFDDLGLNKAILVARRIVKIDPYLRLRVYTEGVTHTNVDAFLDGLDLLLEECDSLPLKYLMREKARARRLNIIFAGDERGFLSLEPYGTHPQLPAFHGRVTGPQPPRDAYATPGEFLRALTVWLGGWDAISERSRRSLEGVGTTVGGYPQLAGEARLAAGQLAWFARKLLLGETVEPFVGHLDLDELVARPTA